MGISITPLGNIIFIYTRWDKVLLSTSNNKEVRAIAVNEVEKLAKQFQVDINSPFISEKFQSEYDTDKRKLTEDMLRSNALSKDISDRNFRTSVKLVIIIAVAIVIVYQFISPIQRCKIFEDKGFHTCTIGHKLTW